MPRREFTVEPARLRDAEHQVADWAGLVDEHTAHDGAGHVPRAVDAAVLALQGSALADALTAAGVATFRAGDGVVVALRSLSDGLARAAGRYEAADREARRAVRRPEQ